MCVMQGFLTSDEQWGSSHNWHQPCSDAIDDMLGCYCCFTVSEVHGSHDCTFCVTAAAGGGFVAGDARMCARSFYHWMAGLANQGIHSKVSRFTMLDYW